MKHIKSSDNNGFTLLEVLIAVMILAIVIVPMLHSFVSSHRINSKSKQYMRATTLAQDEMEIFERSDMEEILGMVDDGTYEMEEPAPDDNGCYFFSRKGINNDGTGSSASSFDVYVTLDPERSTNSSRYYNANTQELFYMNTFGRNDTAIHIQSMRTASNEYGYDDNIYKLFEANKDLTGAGGSWNTDDFEKNLARRIKVNIYQENNGLNMATIVKVTYEYALWKDGIMSSGNQTYSEETIVFNNSAQGVDGDGNLPELRSVYLFYSPRYEGYSGTDAGKGYTLPQHNIPFTVNGENVLYNTDEDWIVIENEAKLPIDIYVVRQDIFESGSTTDIEEVPIEYQPRIEIHDGLDSDGHTIGHYFTNLNIDSPEAPGVGRKIKFSYKDVNSPGAAMDYDLVARTKIDPKPLSGAGSSQAQAKDRIYTMTVKVYTHEADVNTATPIVSMTGSKIE